MKKKLKLLIVDDEPLIAELISEEFIDHGHQTRIAFSGNEAINILETEKFDVIISDYRMPNGNGLKLLLFINQLEMKPYFILASAQADESECELLKLGVNRFFNKPFDIFEIVKSIEFIIHYTD